jgi:transcription termination/antitermination protein NusG
MNFSQEQLLVFLIGLKHNTIEMADINVKKWYVVRAVSGQENKVKAYIETEINRLGMGDYISQVLVPTEKVVQVRDGKNI